jgi:hypothetical protein
MEESFDIRLHDRPEEALTGIEFYSERARQWAEKLDARPWKRIENTLWVDYLAAPGLISEAEAAALSVGWPAPQRHDVAT